MRKFIIFLLSVLSIFCFVMTACESEKVEYKSGKNKAAIVLNIETLDMELNDEFTIIATTKNMSGESALNWESSNEKIASVDATGKVVALTEGSVTITATCGSVRSMCYVNVVDNGYVPTIRLADSKLNLIIGDAYKVYPKFVLKGQEVSSRFTYFVENENVLGIDGEIVTAKNVGETKFTVSTTYNGKTYSEEVFVKVLEDIVIETSKTEVVVYTSDAVEGKEKEQTISYAVKIDGVDGEKTVVANYDKDVIDVEIGKDDITVKSKIPGKTTITLEYEEKGVTYNSYIAVSSEIPVYERENVYVIKSEQVGETVKLLMPASVDLDNFVSFDFNEETNVETNKDGNGLVISNTKAYEGKNTYTANFTDVIVKGNAYYVDTAIFSTTDFDNFMKKVVSYGVQNTSTQGTYVVLAADIDYAGKNLCTQVSRSATAYNTYWCGTFDGLGHTISNIVVDRGGVFGYISGGQVKDLGLVNVTSNKEAKDTGGLLCMMLTNKGVIDNCYVEGTFTKGGINSGAVACMSYNGCTVTNCITNVSGSYWAICGQGTVNNLIPKESYGISADATYSYRTSSSELYRGSVAFLTKFGGFNTASGWNEQWNIVDGQLCFGTYSLENIETLDGVKQLYVGDDFKLDLSKKKITTVSKVKLGESEIGYDFIDGVLTIGKAELKGMAGGTQSLTITTNGCKYVQKLLIVTDRISTKQDFIDFLAGVAGLGSQTTKSSSQYAVLTNDIDLENYDVSKITNKVFNKSYWCGTFDGCGYVVKNIVVDRGGVFSRIEGGTVKNLGLVNVVNDKPSTGTGGNDTGGGLLAAYLSGATVENCYVEGKYVNLHETKHGESVLGAFCYGTNYLKNNVIKVENVVYGVAQVGQTANTPKNFVISSNAQYSYTGNSKANLYATVEAFIGAYTITSTDGFNSQWHYEDGNLYFGSEKI